MLAIAFVVLSSGSTFADELWNPHLRGIDEGCASGALPPKGLYFVDDNYFASMKYYDGNGKGSSEKLDVFVNAPILLWSPGIKVLHATYAAAIAQPFDYTSMYSTTSASLGNAHWGAYNTIIIPAILSWPLAHNTYVKATLATMVADPTTSPGHPAPNNGVGSGNNFWTVEPGVAVSWLRDGWNLSADAKYDHNYKDTATDYVSGDEIAVDYTATKTIHQWVVGVGGYQENQLNLDKENGVNVPGTIRLTDGAGPIVGYNFGPVDLTATFNYNICTHNDFGGNFINIRLVAPLK